MTTDDNKHVHAAGQRCIQLEVYAWGCTPHWRSSQITNNIRFCLPAPSPDYGALSQPQPSASCITGQTVLVLGAAGGVGVAAVQISKVLGAKVVAVARGAEKAKLLKDLGADAVIDTSATHQGGGAGPSRQRDPSEEGYGALGGPGAQQGPALRDLIKQVAPEGTPT